jgi:hypothetical protein
MNSLGVRRRILWHAPFDFLNADVDNSAFLGFLSYIAGNLLYRDVSKVRSAFTISGSYVLWTF